MRTALSLSDTETVIVLSLKSLTTQNILTSRHNYHIYCYMNVELAGTEGKVRTGKGAKNIKTQKRRGIVRIKIIKLRRKKREEKQEKENMRKENPRIRRQGKENKEYWFIMLPENCGLPRSDGSFVVSK